MLVLKCRRTRLNSEVSYSEKDFICRKTHDKKKEEAKPKLSGEKKYSFMLKLEPHFFVLTY